MKMKLQTKSKSLLFSAVAASLLSFAQHVSADAPTVTGTFDGYQPNTVGTSLTSNYNDGYTPYNTSVGTVAGIYNFTADNVATAALLGANFKGVCVDFTHNVTYGQPNIQWELQSITKVNSAVNGVGIDTSQVKAITYLYNNDFNAATSGGADAAAAFQLAVWDLIYDGSLYSTATPSPTVGYGGQVTQDTTNAFGGNSSPTDAAEGAALAAAAWSNLGSIYSTDVYCLISNSGNGGAAQFQSFAFVKPIGSNSLPPTGLPLPASAGVGFSMLAGFGALAVGRKHLKLSRRLQIA